MKHYTVLLRFLSDNDMWMSGNGNPRWLFSAQTADGKTHRFKTARDVSSVYSCNFHRLKRGDVIRARYHWTARGTPMVDIWDDTISAGVDLSSQFAALELQHQFRAGLSDPKPTPSNSRQ